MVVHRKDKTTGPAAVAALKERLLAIQTVIAPDSKNKVSCKVPSIKKLTTNEDEVFEEPAPAKTDQKNYWLLSDRAYKSAAAFKNAVHVRRAGVIADKCASENRKIARAIDKEADDLFGDLLLDARAGLFNAEKAHLIVASFVPQSSNN